MIRPAPSGVLRSGSRKKATHQMVMRQQQPAQPGRQQEGQQVHRREERDERIAFAMNSHAPPMERGSRIGCPSMNGALYQATRLPVKGKEPNEPALTLPDSLSPSTVPVKSRVSGMGEVILADQLTVVAVDLAVFQRAGALCGLLGAGQGGAVGGDVQGGLLRAHGRIDDDFPLAVHGHAVSC